MFTMKFALLPLLASLAIANPLGPYKISDITSSGVSSGGFMASQVHVAFSSVVNGSAIFAAVFSCISSYVDF